VKEYTIDFRKILIMLGISPRNSDVVRKYLWDLHKILHKQVILFKHRTIDKECVQTKHLENILGEHRP
jgi:hypothetical protein